MKRTSWIGMVAFCALAFVPFVASRGQEAEKAKAQEQTVSGPAITGTMSIDFASRYKLDQKGNPDKDAFDSYKLTGFDIVGSPLQGMIKRLPGKEGWIGLTTRRGVFDFDLQFIDKEGDQQAFKGRMEFDPKTGRYSIGGMKIFNVGDKGSFSGGFRGKQGSKNLAGLKKMTLNLGKGGKQKIEINQADPIYFDSDLMMGQGPLKAARPVSVTGSLVYDYDTGSYATGDLKIGEDLITGTISWNKDVDYDKNGKSTYAFDLRYNEDRYDEDSEDVPMFKGSIEFVDTFQSVGDGGEKTVTKSDVKYNLKARNLTKGQVHNFFKLWLLIVGPTNDE